jgi:hypothetical protein
LLGKDHKLHFDAKPDMKNENTKEYLEFIQAKCLANLNSLEHAPSVGITDFIVQDFYNHEDIERNQLVHKADTYNDLSGQPIVKSYQ